MVESIYQIIPPKPVPLEKPPMYRSRHSPRLPPTASTFHQGTTVPVVSNLNGDAMQKVVPDRESRTLGKPPGSNANTPRDYLQKSSKMEAVPTLAEVKVSAPHLLQPERLKPRHKTAVPSRSDEPIMNVVSTKNFVVANAVEAILGTPRKVQEGAKDYLRKEDYGKVPKYLHHIKQDINAEYEYIRQLEQQREDSTRSQVRPMSEDERGDLIDGLKQKWEQVNNNYQATTHLTKLDTVGKIKRKEAHEAVLGQIEKDIEKLNRKNIMVNAGY